MPNYAFKPLPDCENGHRFEQENFTRLEPNTPAFAGKTGLTFVECNLTNCVPPADSVYIRCKPYNISFCTNAWPKLINKGLSPCVENCSHGTADTITIDGVVVSTFYTYEHKEVV